MIQIAVRRAGLVVVAWTKNDLGQSACTWAFTEEGARRRLCRALDKPEVFR